MTRLWLTSRSAYERGLDHCAYARYLEYHYRGRGIVPVASSIPLATGIEVHNILGQLLKGLAEHDARLVIQHGVDSFRSSVKAFRGEAQDRYDHIVNEQAALIEGLSWAYYRVMLPYVLGEFEIKDIETEEYLIIGCDCGLSGVGDLEAHEARQCNAVLWQSRPDFIAVNKSNGNLSYHEFKTTSTADERWLDSWRDNVQFASGILAAERRLGREIPEYYVHGLVKGKRRKEYNPLTKEYSGPKRQDSIFCHAWHKDAQPPLEPEDWKWSYEWTDQQGATRRLGPKYKKAPLWTANFPQKPAEWSNIEYWVKGLPEDVVAAQLAFVGPYQKPVTLLQEWLKDVPAEEANWHYLDRSGENLGYDDESYADIVHAYAPRSWGNCRGSWYAEDCEYLPVCYRHGGFEDPLTMTDDKGQQLYQWRQPNHQLERERLVQINV